MVILTRRLRAFISDPVSFPHRRAYKHFLKKRLEKALKDLEVINDFLLEESLARGRSRVQIPPGPKLYMAHLQL